MPGFIDAISEWQTIADIRRELRRLRSTAIAQTSIGEYNEYTLASSSDSAHTLTYIPSLSLIPIACLNGLAGRYGTDYTVDFTTGIVTWSATKVAGDVLEVFYQTTGDLVALSGPVDSSLLPPVGMEAWYRADQASVSGSDVTTWTDMSANGNNGTTATGTGTVTLASSAINGQPAVAFNGSGYLNAGLTGRTTGAFSAFVVFKCTETTPANTFFGGGTSARQLRVMSDTTTAGHLEVLRQGVSNVSNDTASTIPKGTAATWLYAYALYDGSSSVVFRRGGSTNTVAASAVTFSNTGGFTIGKGYFGQNNVNDEQFEGQIAEILIYSGVLGSTDLASVASYITNRYGLT